MSAPRIVDVCHAAPELLAGLDLHALLVASDRSAFVVVRSGTFAGRWFERGEVVLCQAGSRTGQAVVLVAHTRGRPLLGHQRGGGFTGDRGEPCSRSRWFAAGAIVAVWSRRDLIWKPIVLAGELDDTPGLRLEPMPASEHGWGALPASAQATDLFQLSLFQARAA